MARLKPYEILQNGGQYGKSHREVIAMLEHYGFEQANGNSAAPHQVFKHREYSEIPLVTVSKGSGEIEPKYVLVAAKACMRVKELNAARKAGGGGALDALPEWLAQCFAPEFTCEVDANRVMRVTHGANGSPPRSYTISHKDGALQVRSVEFAHDNGAGFRFHFNQGDRNPAQNFRRQFQELDELVQVTIADNVAPNPKAVQVVENTKPARNRTIP